MNVPPAPSLVSLATDSGTLRTGTVLKVYWSEDDAWYTGEVVGYEAATETHTIHYQDGDVEQLALHEEKFEIVHTVDPSEKKVVPWSQELRAHLYEVLNSDSTSDGDIDAVVTLIGAALADHTVNNYKGKVKRFLNFCKVRNRQALPASLATGLLYMQDLHSCTTIQAESFQPYMSCVNTMHQDLGFPPPLVGHLIDHARKGSMNLQNRDSTTPKRYWIASDHVSKVLDLGLVEGKKRQPDFVLLRACTFLALGFAWMCRSDTSTSCCMRDIEVSHAGITLVAVSQKGRKQLKFKPVYRIPPGAVRGLEELLQIWLKFKKEWLMAAPSDGLWSMHGEGKRKFTSADATAWTRLVLQAVGAEPPLEFKFDGHGSRSGAATGANSVGVSLQRICFVADWSVRSSAVHDYIDLSAPPTQGAFRFFGWLVPSLDMANVTRPKTS